MVFGLAGVVWGLGEVVFGFTGVVCGFEGLVVLGFAGVVCAGLDFAGVDFACVVFAGFDLIGVEDTIGGGRTKGPHGSLDIRSLATYRLRRDGPPQISLEFPLHGMLQSLVGAEVVPLPSTTPQ